MASKEFIDLWRELEPAMKRFHSRTEIADFRSDWDAMFTVADPTLAVRHEDVDADGVPARWIYGADAADSDRTILYLHGGGFVLGSLESHGDLMARISRAARCKLLGVAYRLAPEHPFPAANEDIETVWNWLLAHGQDPRKAAIMGDSAGGGLVLTTALRLRELARPQPASLVMFSPWVDLTQSGNSMTRRARVDRMVTAEILGTMAAVYFQACTPSPSDVRAYPLNADFSGLAPLLAQVGADEVLYDDAARIIERASAAGVHAELAVYADMCHVFQLFAHRIPEARDAIAKAVRFVLEHFDDH
ncbi:MAG: alpha/beta hydrolase [Nevskiaceae bacterium]|nr:MAG: alpha/beta hydrolase [Nevskiaceae bacterium]TBR74311.1 MAG: alpha/beta hydrolase [Nevskiaceae bacterium]